MRYFLLLQGGCETINEQPYRSMNFATIDTIGMSDITAQNTGNPNPNPNNPRNGSTINMSRLFQRDCQGRSN